MIIVVDANILFSALIKDSKTREIIIYSDECMIFPSYIYDEIKKHKHTLVKKSELPEKDFNKLLQLLFDKIIVVPDNILKKHKYEAIKIAKDIDPDDALFIACALAYPNSVIWSNDKQLKNQSKVRVMNTEEIIRSLRSRR